MNRTVIIALSLFAIVVVAVVLAAREKPMDESATRAFEARCMATYDLWMQKKGGTPAEIAGCEKHYADKGNSIQASFFASARRTR